MVPPQVRPTANASSSEYPKLHRRGVPVSNTSRAAVTTAPSTHPPDTDPATSPSSLTAMAAPGPRGPEPTTSTTRASATLRPWARHRSMSSRMSFMPTSSCSGRQDLQQGLERGHVVPRQELVDVRQGRRHAQRQRLVVGVGLQWIDPDVLVHHPVEPGHLGPELVGVPPVPAVGE